MTKNFRKILVCIKDSLPKRILDKSIRCAHRFNSKVTLLHIQDPEVKTLKGLKKELNSSLTFPDTHGKVPFLNTVDISLIKEIEEKHEQNSEKILNEASKYLEKNGVLCNKAVISGDPVLQIIEYSKRENCDLIILGSEKGKLKRMLFGSTSSKVKESSKIPVVVVKQ